MSFSLKTKPSVEPIDADYVKEHTRIEDAADDGWIATRIVAARQYAEKYTGRPFVTQTWVYRADCFDEVIALKPNLSAVSSVKYWDVNGVGQTLNSALYDVDLYKEIGEVLPAYGEDWPSVRNHRNVVEIEFVCGYGTAANVPDDIKQALAMLVCYWYENREAAAVGVSVSEAPFSVEHLLNPYRVLGV